MEVPRVDYNKANLQWADRIAKENLFSSTKDLSQFFGHGRSRSVQGKIGNLPSPSEQRQRVLEFMKLKEAAESNFQGLFSGPDSPRSRFLFPQSSSQNLGWAISGQYSRNRRKEGAKKGTVTGLYNKVPGSPAKVSLSGNAGHSLGYVTLVGEDSHPRKGNEENFLGDRPLNPSIHTGLSVPTTILRDADRRIVCSMENQRQFMNRIGSNKWYRPLISNEMSMYGDAYVRCMGSGPFSKTQMLVSR